MWRRELSPDVIAGHPVYFRRHDAGNLFAQLVVADAATGEDITVSEPLLFGSHPGACALGTVRDHDPDGVDTLDLSDRRVVAIDRTTGETLWSEDGVDHLCGYVLNLPTDEAVASTAGGDDHVSRLPVPVRCRLAGRVSFDNRDPDAEAVREGISVVLEGFDPATGRVTWEVTPDDPGQLVRGILGEDHPVIRAGATGVVVRVDGQETVVDLATGQTRRAEDGETFWCAGPVPTFDYREPYYVDGEPVTQRYGQEHHGWCDASGEPLPESATAPTTVPNDVGVRAGDLIVVATPNGLRAYREGTADYPHARRGARGPSCTEGFDVRVRRSLVALVLGVSLVGCGSDDPETAAEQTKDPAESSADAAEPTDDDGDDGGDGDGTPTESSLFDLDTPADQELGVEFRHPSGLLFRLERLRFEGNDAFADLRLHHAGQAFTQSVPMASNRRDQMRLIGDDGTVYVAETPEDDLGISLEPGDEVELSAAFRGPIVGGTTSVTFTFGGGIDDDEVATRSIDDENARTYNPGFVVADIPIER